MAEEFHETDVIFSDHHHRRRRHHFLVSSYRNSQNNNDGDDENNNKHFAASTLRPVKIPETVYRYAATDMDDVEWDSDDDMVPPHVIVGRRVAGKMAFSVCTGNGRTLKGRDLSQVRNSILRMTGFLET